MIIERTPSGAIHMMTSKTTSQAEKQRVTITESEDAGANDVYVRS